MKRKILVIEDDPHIRLGLCDALTGEGYDVIECGDGAQAMPLLRQRKPDLLVLDLMLPHKSGYDLCRDIRSEKNEKINVSGDLSMEYLMAEKVLKTT